MRPLRIPLELCAEPSAARPSDCFRSPGESLVALQSFDLGPEPAVEVDDPGRWRCEQCFDDLWGRTGDKRDVGAGNRLFGTFGENAPEVRKLGFDVLAVRTDKG